MGRRNKVVCASVSLIILLLSLTACTNGEMPEPAVTNNERPRTAVTSAGAEAAATFTLPASLKAPAEAGPDEQLLFQTSSQTESASYGPVATKAKTVLYIRCAGSGSINFRMQDVVTFVVPCEKDGVAHGMRNLFDTRFVKNPNFSVDSSPGQIWSLGIYSEPVP